MAAAVVCTYNLQSSKPNQLHLTPNGFCELYEDHLLELG